MAEESGWLVGSRQILVNFYFTELNIEIYKNLPKAHPQMVWWRHHDSWPSQRQILVDFYSIKCIDYRVKKDNVNKKDLWNRKTNHCHFRISEIKNIFLTKSVYNGPSILLSRNSEVVTADAFNVRHVTEKVSFGLWCVSHIDKIQHLEQIFLKVFASINV